MTIAAATLSLALAAAVLTGTPSEAVPEFVASVKPSPDKNTKEGEASERGKASAQARKSKKRVEVKGEQTATDSVFANPDGTFSQERAAAPIRAKDTDGKLAPIDTTLEKKDSGLAPKVATGEVSFSGTGDGDLAKYEVSDGASVGLDFAGDLGTPTTDGSSATYPVAGSTTEQVRVAALPDGFVSHVLLSQVPVEAPTYTFTLDLNGLTAKLVNNRLELSNDKGTVVAESRPFQMWDAARDNHGDPSNTASVDAELVKGSNGSTELRLSPSMAYLSNPATQYPVTVDPDIAKVEDRGDTYYWENQPSNDSRGSDYRLRTGEEGGNSYRALVTWAYEDYVGQTVTNATLKLHQYSSETCIPKRSDFHPTTADTDATIVWATRPPVETSDRFRSSKTYNHGQSPGCPDTTESINVTPIVSAWAGGIIDSDTAGNDRQGIELRAEDENDASQEKRYCSLNLSGGGSTPECNSTSKIPVLSVTYAAELGDESFYSMTKHPLNGTSSLAVNNRSGNAFVSASDATVNARGVPFDLSRSYNSQAPETTSMGRGWNLGLGADVWLEKRSQYRYDYHSPDGTVFGSFVRKTADSGSSSYDNFFTPLGGVGADLDQDPADDEFILTMRDSQMKYRFKESGSAGHAYLNKITDRSGNAMTLSYSGTTGAGVPKLSTFTDAGGRSYAVTYTGDYITSVTENTGLGRVWKYEYNTGGYLTSYTDPDNKKTDYTYDTGFTGPDLLKSITNPANATGQRPTTNLTYALDSGLDVDQVVKVGYVLNDDTTYEYSFEYFANDDVETPICDNSEADFSSRVTDPNAAKTTHCFKNRDSAAGKAKEWIYDGEGRERSEDFNADRQSEILTEGISGSTVATYAASTPDQLKTMKEPDSDTGRTGAKTDIDYDHSGGGDSSPDGGKYLPGSVTDPNGDCVRYEYDSEGRTTASITDLRGSGTDRSCATASGGAKHTFTYNSDGTIAKSTDPNAGASPTDADRTIYTYWASGDAGFVAGSAGLVKSVREPGGDCSTTTSERKLCTSYTYDAAGRTATSTNGKNEKTTMQYDKLDRTTGVFFGGATACGLLDKNQCIVYTYDAEGNLTKREEQAGTTSFTYDRMNRQITHTQPGSIVMEMSYDGVANMTGYTQKIGAKTDTVTYAYDKGNIVSSVADSAGTINVNADDDANIEEYIFPGSQGIKIDMDVKDNGKTESAEVLANQGSGSTLYKIAYDYTDGTVDEDQMQSRTTSSAGADLNGTIDYEYEVGRLFKATDSSTAGPNFEYGHDKIGNVTSETKAADTTHYGYDRAGQLCWRGPSDGPDVSSGCSSTPAGNTTLNQDAAGNNTNTSGSATTYNNRDQATTLGGIAMSYRDLGNDLRTKAGDTSFVDGPVGITGTYATDLFGNTTVTWFTRLPDGTILNSRKGSVTQNYFAEPHNGSAAALFSSTGERTGTYTYSPYGETAASGAAADANPFRYISGYQDTAGAEDYYKLGARYYDGHGHFTQPDPVAGSITDPRTMTAYNYAFGDPVTYLDPTGLCGVRKLAEDVATFGGAGAVTGTTIGAGLGLLGGPFAPITVTGGATGGAIVGTIVGGIGGVVACFTD